LRERVNSSPKVYCPLTGGPTAWYVHESSRLFPLAEKVEVKIKSARQHALKLKNMIKVDFEHRSLGRGSISFFWPKNVEPDLAGFREMFRYAFSENREDDGFLRFVGNRESKRLHYIGCNHLPAESRREYFATEQEAASAGYRNCDLCFRNFPPLADYSLEMALGRMIAAEVMNNYQPSDNRRFIKQVSEAGRRVLDNWPTPLRGYYYSFQVVRSGAVNAFACAGGKIFVTTGLMYAIESENELEGILAHEIAHVERRHSLRAYKNAKAASFWTWLAGAGAGLAAAAAAKDKAIEAWTLDMVATMSALAARWVLMGYGRSFEQEADFCAVAYLKNAKNDDTSYPLILQKMQYSANLWGQIEDTPTVFDSHPQIDFRVECARNAKVGVFQPDLVFTGYDRNDEVVAEVKLESQCLSKGIIPGEEPETHLSDFYTAGRSGDRLVQRLYLYATVRATTGLGESDKIEAIRIKTRNSTVRLDNKEDTVLFPTAEIGCTFERDTDEMLREIEGIELNLKNVKEWRRNY